MNKVDQRRNRIKFVISWLIMRGYANNQEDIGVLVGITNKSYLSQLISGKTNNDDFIKKLSSLDDSISEEWLLNGGDDIPHIDIIQKVNGNGNTSVVGNSNNVNNSSTIDNAIHEISEQRKLVAKSQEQIDRMLSIIEQLSK